MKEDKMNNGTFSGKVALVTGGTSGIDVCSRFADVSRRSAAARPLADPLMRGLRHDARYTDLLVKVGLPRSI